MGIYRSISRHLFAIRAVALLRILSSFLEAKAGPPRRREDENGYVLVALGP